MRSFVKRARKVLATDQPVMRASRRNWLIAPLAFGLSALLLFGSVAYGLEIPAVRHLKGFASSRSLDYSLFREGFSPLRRAFIESVFGSLLIEARGGGLPGGLRSATARRQRVVIDHPPTNDNFADSLEISSVPFTARTNTLSATREPNEAGSCAPAGGTVWYRFSSSKQVGLVANTYGSNHATSLAIFSGSSLESLRAVGCDTDSRGYSLVPFAASPGKTYYFQVTAPAGGGRLVFNLNPLGATERVSVSSGGGEGNDESEFWFPAISAEGRFVAFGSSASNLVLGDTNQMNDVFVRDRLTGTTSRVSVSSSGQEGSRGIYPEDYNYCCYTGSPSISNDGRYVAFDSQAMNLVPRKKQCGDNYETGDFDLVVPCYDFYVHDRSTGRTTRASVSSSGEDANFHSYAGSISADGKHVAFTSGATNLAPVPSDSCSASRNTSTSGYPTCVTYVFVRDLVAGQTSIVSASSTGEVANNDSDSFEPSLSAEGRYVAFSSLASNLVVGDTNSHEDIFVRDTLTKTTSRVSISSDGRQGDWDSFEPTISADGRYVAFKSGSTNLPGADATCRGEPGTGHRFGRSGGNCLFVHDRLLGTTIRVATGCNNGQGYRASISSDARYLSFSCRTNQAPGDDNPDSEIFVHDLRTGAEMVASLSSTGERGRGKPGYAGIVDNNFSRISADGKWLTYMSAATNLVDDDNNGFYDIFVHDISGFTQ